MSVQILFHDAADERGRRQIPLRGLDEDVPVQPFGKVKLDSLDTFFGHGASPRDRSGVHALLGGDVLGADGG
jgi:hypothetical protein